MPAVRFESELGKVRWLAKALVAYSETSPDRRVVIRLDGVQFARLSECPL